MKKKAIACVAFALAINIAMYSQLIKTNGFADYGKSYESMAPRNEKDYVSPNGKYLAFCEGNAEYLAIIDNTNKLLFRTKWNDVSNVYTWSDNIYISGWDSSSRYLWFMSWTPTNIAYIARVDLIDQKCIYWDSPRLDKNINNFFLDWDKGIFYYTDFYRSPDPKDLVVNIGKTYIIYVYDIIAQKSYTQGSVSGKELMSEKYNKWVK